MTAIGFIPWKPAACACGSAHPCFSMTGPQGPWRCHQCHHLAISAALAIPSRKPATIEAPHAKQEGLLL